MLAKVGRKLHDPSIRPSMSARTGIYGRRNYRFLPVDRPSHAPDSSMEIEESDLWNSGSPERRRSVPSSRTAKKQAERRGGGSVSSVASSLPVKVPELLKEEHRGSRRRESEEEVEEDDGGSCRMTPPHEVVARQLERTRIASFSLYEGVGRTLKGRDLIRVRNAVWEKMGFQD